MSQRQYIPFGKPNFSSAEIEAVAKVLQSGWVGMGPETLAFEEELAAAMNVKHVVTVNSCTSALFLSLLMHGIGPGDEVICPSLTWCSSANAAVYLGATAVFCDVDRDTMCADVDDIQRKVTPRTKAVVVVHFGGLAVDVGRLRSILAAPISIVEDAAHALGSRFPDGRTVGSSGNLTCFSFYANKNLSTAEGGAIALHDDAMADKLRSLRQHGLPNDAWRRFIDARVLLAGEPFQLGYKMNFTDLQASIGRVQLRRQDSFHAIRLDHAKRYFDRLTGEAPDLTFQHELLSVNHSRHLFVARLPVERLSMDRNEFVLALRERGIGASIHYPPLHAMSFYHSMGAVGRLPETEWLSERIVTLPIGAAMTRDDVDYICDSVLQIMGANRT